MILFCGLLLWGNITKRPFSIELFVYTQTLAYVLTALTALVIVIRKARFVRLHWNIPFFIMIIKQSFPFAILVLLMTFYNRIDSVMIERLIPGTLGDEQAGIYASAYRLLDAANMIAYLFSVLLLPLFSHMVKIKEDVSKLVKLSFTLLFILSIVVAAGSYLYSENIMSMLYPQHKGETLEIFKSRMRQTSTIFGTLMFGFIPISTTYIFGTLLTANGNLKQLNIIAATGMILNILFNLFLIPKFMATGAAYVSMFTQFLSASIQILISLKIFKFKISISYMLRIIFYVLLVFCFGYLSTKFDIMWIKSFVLFICASVIFAFATGLLKIKAFINIIKKEEMSN
jgi:O-antigen/teichoic acid export membrane protein